MRDEYSLEHGRANPYLKKLGARGREDLVAWWATIREGVRVLPKDVAEAFPDTESTVEALRLVMRLREVGERLKPRRARTRLRASKSRAGK